MREQTNGRPAHQTAGETVAPTPGQSNRRLLTADQVAEQLGVSVAWIYEQSRAGRIPTVTLGRYRRYRPEAISAWIEELEHASHTPGPQGRTRRREPLRAREPQGK